MTAGRRAVLAVVTLLLLAPVQSCGDGRAGGSAPPGDRTVDDIAVTIPGVPDHLRLADALRQANGGRSVVPEPIAKEVLDPDNIAHRIIEGTDARVDDACSAFQHGQVALDGGGYAAQRLLTEMWAELSTRTVQADTLSLACAVHAALTG
jgi:hypothetical protein